MYEEENRKLLERNLPKLWEFAGFEFHGIDEDGYDIYLNGELYDEDIDLPLDPERGLDWQFKYLVPKLREQYPDLMIKFVYTSTTSCSLYNWGKLYSRKKNWEWLKIGEATNKTEAVALGMAILKWLESK